MDTTAKKASHRVWAYDLVRAASMLWVVALWHNHLTTEGTVAYAITIAVYAAYPGLWIHIPMALSGAVLIIEAALWIEHAMRGKGAFLKKVITSISAASMIAYLFHRQYFILFNPIVEMTEIQVLRIVFLPVFLFLCFYVQKLYSKAISKLQKSLTKA